MRLWKVIEFKGDYIIFPKTHFYCPFCSEEMLLHDFRTYRSSLGFYFCDVHMKCVNCSFWCVFGVRVSRDEHEKLKNSKYHGKILLDELKELYPQYKNTLEERLKTWGYW